VIEYSVGKKAGEEKGRNRLLSTPVGMLGKSLDGTGEGQLCPSPVVRR
jgi:hypothetical protein